MSILPVGLYGPTCLDLRFYEDVSQAYRVITKVNRAPALRPTVTNFFGKFQTIARKLFVSLIFWRSIFGNITTGF